MSTRWYPIYQRGNPQLRVFLPNFWMKLVKPHLKQLPNIVHFQCSMEMTKLDIKNYLKKIYNVPVTDVRTKITMGKFKRDVGKGYIVKNDDIKFAYITLVHPPADGPILEVFSCSREVHRILLKPKNIKFEYPDLFVDQKEAEDEDAKSLDEAKNTFKGYLERNKDRSDVPSWFSI